MTGFISYKKSRIHYYRSGDTGQLLLCLHGYSQSAHSFAFLETVLAKKFRLIAIDLPFHGQTLWNEAVPFIDADLFEIVKEIAGGEKQLKSSGLHLLGYSMGGRIALSFFQQYPGIIKSICLVAPDGLHQNRWQRLATRTSIGNKLFKYTMRKPAWFLQTVRLSGKARLVNKSLLKFVDYYFENETVRTALYQRWTALRQFAPRVARIRQLAHQHNVPVRMLFGEDDEIIRHGAGLRFSSSNPQLFPIKIIKAGHHLLHPKYLPELTELVCGGAAN